MDWVQGYVLILAALATLLLALEKAPLSVIGIGLIVAVAAPGLVDAGPAVAGFSNKAVVTVGALFIVGEGFLRTGAASILASRILARTGGKESTVVFLIMGMAAVLSAFVNNVLVVITFLPVITSICRETGIYPSRLLIPLSYASILGGMCTLVGTSTNLLVSGVLEDCGKPALEMFEMSYPALILAGVGILFIGFIGRFLLPRIHSLAGQHGAEDLKEYVTEITIGTKSALIGTAAKDLGKLKDGHGMSATMLIRAESLKRTPFKESLVIAEGDILVVSGKVDDLAGLHREEGQASEESAERYKPGSMSFFELAVTPNSTMTGRRIRTMRLKARHGAVVVGVLRDGDHLQSRYLDLRLRTGDVLLAFGDTQSRESLRASSNFNLIEGVSEKIFQRDKAPWAVAIILSVVAMFISGTINPCIAALAGALAMVVTGCLSMNQANRAIQWPVIMFIAGTLALSKAMQSTGTDVVIGTYIQDSLGQYGPQALLIGIYCGTIILTELLSNNAVAVIMTPIALAVAEKSGVDYRALVMAVALGASTCFANPMGYKTNLMVYGPGGYRFRDFVRSGLGLDILLGGIGVVVLPWFFPL